jgi:hypothetical protein
VEHIRHWRVTEGDYTKSPDVRATWFVDPPYILAGKDYRSGCSSKNLDYATLGAWCKSRKGQVMVCENAGASWLPFKTFRTIRGANGTRRTGVSEEVIWGTKDCFLAQEPA